MVKLGEATKKISAFAIIFACVLFAWLPRSVYFSHGEGEPLGAVDYLDYTLVSPTAIYADEDVIAVACEDKTAFFYDGKIYERPDVKPRGQILRSGNRLYYSSDNNLKFVEIGIFEQVNPVKTVGASAFAVSGERLITLTNDGAKFYGNLSSYGTDALTELPAPYEFPYRESLIALGNVYIAGDEYFCINNKLHRGIEELFHAEAEYMTDVNGRLVFASYDEPTDGYRIFAYDGQSLSKIYPAEENATASVKGLSGYGDRLLFIDGETDAIMQIELDGSGLKPFMFDVQINTPLTLSFTDTPAIYRLEKGKQVHRGEVSGGQFTLSSTEYSKEQEELVMLGSVEGYLLLYGKSGYLLSKGENLSLTEQNTPITLEKGYILYSCNAYLTPIATEQTESFELKRGDLVTIKKQFKTNGTDFSLIEFDGKQGYVLTGELTEKLVVSPTLGEQQEHNVSAKDNTITAIVIIIISTVIFILALFLLLSKKEYIKL